VKCLDLDVMMSEERSDKSKDLYGALRLPVRHDTKEKAPLRPFYEEEPCANRRRQ
jgi:hypothetical protein